jgi:ATP-dependent protease HslVU (ClpYQ) peptidase subunit
MFDDLVMKPTKNKPKRDGLRSGLPPQGTQGESLRSRMEARSSVTICAAVLCKLPKKRDAIICVSDRMISWGETPMAETRNLSKAWGLSPAKALAFYAGDCEQHYTVVERTHQYIIDKTISTSIVEIANSYAKNLRGDVVSSGKRPGADAILVGFDQTGAQIYVVISNGLVVIRNGTTTGFVAIGSGQNEFDTHLTNYGYDRMMPFHEALLLTYEAKKQSEADRGVGATTDIFVICRDTLARLRKKGVKELELCHKNVVKDNSERHRILKGMKRRFVVEELSKKAKGSLFDVRSFA